MLWLQFYREGRNKGFSVLVWTPLISICLSVHFVFFRVSNQHTFGIVFHINLSSPELRLRHRKMISDVILEWLTQKDSEEKLATALGRPRGSGVAKTQALE